MTTEYPRARPSLKVIIIIIVVVLIKGKLTADIFSKIHTIKMAAETITTISPTTGKGIITRKGASSEKMLALARSAQVAFQSWSKTTLAQRKEIVTKACGVLEKKKDVLAKEVTEQMGRPISYTDKEVLTAAMRAKYLMSVVDEQLGKTDGLAEDGFRRYIKKVPLGVVLILFPWNVSISCPLLMPYGKFEKELLTFTSTCSTLSSHSSTA